eukprot:TRINITY_DN110230_c0_g1_i1.p1 TRINITY_DN110230_c0_g1~~TRINITY_DN110230_c0_g1_i1.p1  ORF type:complete len:278 (+),score=87.44 TRINITY_DN110230_c0_g1_i1:55-888(+)
MGGFYQGKGGGGGGGGGYYGGKGGASAPAAAEGMRVSGDELPGGLKRKLKALNYPELQSACLSGQAYCKIVLWLEEEKIRLYEKIDRAPLRKFDKAWYEAVEKYAKDLGVPVENFNEKDLPLKLNVLSKLASLAVHDIYRDKVEADELADAVPTQQAAMGEKQRLGQLLPALNRIMAHLKLPQLPDDAKDADINAALRCVLVRVNPSQAEEQPLDLDCLPLGLEVQDPEVRKAVAVLRLLHGQELQQLQVNINTVINELQQLTANPQTDSRLGRVGR